MKAKKSSFIYGALSFIGGIVLLAYMFPFIMVLINAFKPRMEILTRPFALPTRWSFKNFTDAYAVMSFSRVFLNSLFISILSVALIVLFSSTWAYYLVRWKSRFNKVMFTVLIASMIIPFQSLMIPFVAIYGNFHLLNSRLLLGVFYLGFGISLATFMYHGFIKAIPLELEEAAMIDGASRLKTLARIVFPMLRTMTATICILDVLWIWNDFLLPSLVLISEEKRTIPLSTFYFFGKYTSNYGEAMAALVLAILPVIVFYLIMQKRILSGVMDGAIK